MVRIGELLIQSGILTEPVLAEVLELQKTEKRRLGDLLAERGLVPPRKLAQLLSYQLSYPWVSLTNVEIPKELIELFPRELAIKHTAVPVHRRALPEGDALYVALHDPTDEVALGECARAVKLAVRPLVAITYEIRQALSRYYGAPMPSLTTAPQAFAPIKLPAKPPIPKSVTPKPPKVTEPPISEEPISAEPISVPEPDAELPPAVLLVNAPESFKGQVAIAAKTVEAKLEEGNLMSASERAKACRPFAIVVTDDIYAFDRSGLNKLALENDALLVVWGDDVEAHQLEPLLRGAMRRGRR